jgi:hypothetical protein
MTFFLTLSQTISLSTMISKSLLFSLLIFCSFISCNKQKTTRTYSPDPEVCILPSSGESDGNYFAPKASDNIVIDGQGKEKSWETAPWRDIKYRWLGEEFSQQDFQGRYKIVWTEDRLYYLVEIVDNILSDQRKDPFDNWWEDDCLELFIDEDRSKGNHQYSHNAFAYHITLDYDVVDMSPAKTPFLYNDHLEVKRTAKGKLYTWEVAMKVFPDTFKDGSNTNAPVKLFEGKKMGFAVSYNDNDSTGVRENFIGSIDVPGEDKNQGWIDAGIFGELVLIK